MEGADLSNAILRWAHLENANLEKANLEKVDLLGVKYSPYTKWPDDFDPKAGGAILVT
jgi:uncharacterized protein YjbI with pentapeptide repeats